MSFSAAPSRYFIVKILAIVEHSPWGSSLPVTALRLLRAMVDDGIRVEAVYFRGDGVYNAQPGTASDAGTPALTEAWGSFSDESGAALLLCASASRRRLDYAPSPGFRMAGLPEVMERMTACDRVVSF